MATNRKLRIFLFIITIFLALQCSAFAAKYPLTVKDCRGKAVRITREPRRIISTAPSNTEILYALGLGSRIVGVGTWDNYPPEAKKKPKIGDMTTSIEKVISLKPDLVVAHGTLNRDVIPAMEKYGLKVIALDPKSIDQVARDIRMLGKVTNTEEKAAVVAGRITSTKNSIQQKVVKLKKPSVLVSVQGEPLWAAGPKTFIDEMIKIAGGRNIASDAKPGFNQFSAEAAVVRHPAVIIGTDKGSKRIYQRGIWSNTPAARHNRVYEVDPDILVRTGPRLADAMLKLAKIIHPEAFK